ncbi:MAG: hypothetical protein L7H18_02135 [Candidatus Nealsonbacteria bacterium DGGOD1a]|jgi:hypothetical protein|nr:MAG: hypothetical protein L7H18_02135 [Candidatus Nealsonbacteria bacterium DGGOD1a]
MQLKVKQVERIFQKLGMEVKPSHHKLAFFRHNGKLILKTRLSNGSGDAKAIDKIRQDFKLTEKDFCDLRDCPLSKEGYVEILKAKGIITV